MFVAERILVHFSGDQKKNMDMLGKALLSASGSLVAVQIPHSVDNASHNWRPRIVPEGVLMGTFVWVVLAFGLQQERHWPEMVQAIIYGASEVARIVMEPWQRVRWSNQDRTPLDLSRFGLELWAWAFLVWNLTHDPTRNTYVALALTGLGFFGRKCHRAFRWSSSWGHVLTWRVFELLQLVAGVLVLLLRREALVVAVPALGLSFIQVKCLQQHEDAVQGPLVGWAVLVVLGPTLSIASLQKDLNPWLFWSLAFATLALSVFETFVVFRQPEQRQNAEILRI